MYIRGIVAGSGERLRFAEDEVVHGDDVVVAVGHSKGRLAGEVVGLRENFLAGIEEDAGKRKAAVAHRRGDSTQDRRIVHVKELNERGIGDVDADEAAQIR